MTSQKARVPAPGVPLVHFICVAPEHRKSAEIGVTLHEGSWAICVEVLDEVGHKWQRIDAAPMSTAALRWRESVAPDHPGTGHEAT